MLPPIELFDLKLYWFPIMVMIALFAAAYFVLNYKGKDGFEIITVRDRNIYLPLFIIIIVLGLWSFSVLEQSIKAWIQNPDLSPTVLMKSALQSLGNRWYGSMLLSILAIVLFYLFWSKEKVNRGFDLLGLALCLGIAIGRIGCILDGHYGCSGIATDLPWGMVFPYGNKSNIQPVHPIQVYDSLFYFLLFGWLLWLDQKRHLTFGKVGFLFFLFASCYNLLMWVVRDDTAVIGPLSFGQVSYSLIFIMVMILWQVNFGILKRRI